MDWNFFSMLPSPGTRGKERQMHRLWLRYLRRRTLQFWAALWPVASWRAIVSQEWSRCDTSWILCLSRPGQSLNCIRLQRSSWTSAGSSSHAAAATQWEVVRTGASGLPWSAQPGHPTKRNSARWAILAMKVQQPKTPILPFNGPA